jgi:hypothetical protein
MLLSVEDYAQRRGVSDRAVRKAIAAGRLAGSVTRQGLRKWLIDPGLADQEWAANTRVLPPGAGTPAGGARPPKQKRPKSAPKAPPPPPPVVIEPEPVAPLPPPPPPPKPKPEPKPKAPKPPNPKPAPTPPPPAPAALPSSIPGAAQASALRSVFQAKLLELEYKEKTGTLVPKADVDRVWFEEIRRARDAFRRLPLQMIGELAQSAGGLTQEQRANVLLVIERYIVEVLEGLSKDAD